MRSSGLIFKHIAAWKWPLILGCLLLAVLTFYVPALASFDLATPLQHPAASTGLTLFLTLALATLISEDLTCIWAGVMAAEGRISFGSAAFACLLGIFVGDILLFLAGRLLGRAALRRAPLKWFVRTSDVERSSAWFRRRGMAAITLSRFLPGTRLPTYMAAGLLDTGLLKFTFYCLIAAAVWTPLLVGASMFLGGEVIESALIRQRSQLLRLAIPALLLFVLVKLLVRLTSFRGRRLLVARWRRLKRWEFWPLWAFYPPVVLHLGYLGLKHRSLTLFTCANPAIEEGGFVGESKSQILQGLGQAPDAGPLIASWGLLEKSLSPHTRIDRALQFMRGRGLSFPVVLKPDAGERGSGVAVLRSEGEMEDYLLASPNVDVMIQEHVAGLEFGVFYFRYPQCEHGEIFSITRKLFPSLTGDGESTLENLILKDDRAVCMARAYFDARRDDLLDIPATGESVQLIEIGTHCLGSIFLDGIEIKTAELERAIDHLAKAFDGFYFGRFDIRTPSLTDFQHGKNFKVVELNGVTSEATSIYDPKNTLFAAYRVLFDQWRIAFEIGAQNRARGAEPARLLTLARRIVEKWRKQSERSGANLRPINIEAGRVSKFAEEV
ncbi:MAG: VTT domain-containing protein [bacterium]